MNRSPAQKRPKNASDSWHADKDGVVALVRAPDFHDDRLAGP